MDDKSSVIGILEATERLLSEGFQPRRTVYLAFGHDEEVGGPNGAAKIAEVLAARGVDSFAFVLDEGGAIAEDMIPGVDGPVAIIGVAEKGFLSLELLVEGEGGHSSMPPDHTNIGILAAALTKLEDNQFPARLDGATEQMFQYLAPEMSLLRRVVFANLWLLRPVVARLMVSEQSGAAMVRTTTAATMIDGGVKDNVLPIDARAVVNFRIMPGETVESVTARVRDVIADDRVQLRMLANQDPSPVSDVGSEAFRLLGRTIRQVVADPKLKVAPYLVVGGTDAKYYSGRSSNVFRFLAFRASGEDLERVHGTNERLSLENLDLNVTYFYQLLRNAHDL
jgi:carboxypeptidase PM20D1